MFFISAFIGFTFHEQFSVLDDTLRRIAESVEGLNGYQQGHPKYFLVIKD